MVCLAKSEGKLRALEAFCNLIQGQMSFNDCLKTDYAKILGVQNGTTWTNDCFKDALKNASSTLFEPTTLPLNK